MLLLSACHDRRRKHLAVDSTIAVLEQLLARHIVLPSRSSFLTATEHGVARPDVTGITLVLIDALDPSDDQYGRERTPKAGSQSDERVLSTVPLLFEIAIRCVPRESPRKRITEGPWLEGLFLYLMHKLHLPVFSETPVTMSQQSFQILEQVLQTAIDRGVSLDTSILREIVKCFSGLLGSRKEPCQWSLIGKILELDANVFLIPVEVDAVSPASPRGLLGTLFTRITQTGCNIPLTVSDDYDFLRDSIVLPLLREFAKARDLSGFLDLWRAELKAHEELRLEMDRRLAEPRPPRPISIWEDMELTSELKNLLESSLTPGQIDKALSLMSSDFQTSLEGGGDYCSKAYASVVVIEAVFGAIQREETADLVSGTVTKLAFVITSYLDPCSKWPAIHRWRLWSFATLLKLQWHQAWSAALQPTGDVRFWPKNPLIAWALMFIENSSESSPWMSAPSSDSNEFLEALHAFQYILSFDPSEMARGSELDRSVMAIDQALNDIHPFLEDILSQAVHGNAGLTFQWDGRPESLISHGPLVVALATAILRFPRCLK